MNAYSINNKSAIAAATAAIYQELDNHSGPVELAVLLQNTGLNEKDMMVGASIKQDFVLSVKCSTATAIALSDETALNRLQVSFYMTPSAWVALGGVQRDLEPVFTSTCSNASVLVGIARDPTKYYIPLRIRKVDPTDPGTRTDSNAWMPMRLVSFDGDDRVLRAWPVNVE